MSVADDGKQETPDPAVRRAAVVGAGLMGGGIAAELALRVPHLEVVRVWDPAEGAAGRAVERAQEVAEALVGAGILEHGTAGARLGRLRAAPTLE
ncbi:MAG: 3-hydroxyacyl-CoA dehydrogenase NAD-binding domain-containing protein, partial [Chloroflexota bacterium]